MKHCIICRELKDDFNDEHVIPDALQGYYHIYSVCRKCNSFMGSYIDNKLTNHKFVEFQRHILQIKGKSGIIPNPLSGVHSLKSDPDQKVKLELNAERKFVPKLIPKITVKDGKLEVVVDKRDKDQIKSIVDKYLKRNGIKLDKYEFQERLETEENPAILIESKMDFEEYKLGILKIAYEFTIDQLPEYYEDPKAILISEVLREASLEKMNKNVIFFGSGLDGTIMDFLNNYIDLGSDNHYLVLINLPGKGLICAVNLFSTFYLGLLMSDSTALMDKDLIIGKNDFSKRSFEVFDMDKLVETIYDPMIYSFSYLFQNKHSMDEFMENERRPNFSFYSNNGPIPFFNREGEIVYENIDHKLIDLEYTSNISDDKMLFQYELNEELYLKLLPINKLYRVVSVLTSRKRSSKI